MLHVRITTVERTAFDSTEITKVIIPTTEGIITVLPKHEALMTVLDVGVLEIFKADVAAPEILFVDGGVVQVVDNQVEILANMAERADELDEAEIEEAQRRAEKLLSEQPVDVDLALTEAALKRELMRLKVVRRVKAPSSMS